VPLVSLDTSSGLARPFARDGADFINFAAGNRAL